MNKQDLQAAYRAARTVRNIQLVAGAAYDVLRRAIHSGDEPIACTCADCTEAWRIAHRIDASITQRVVDHLAVRAAA